MGGAPPHWNYPRAITLVIAKEYVLDDALPFPPIASEKVLVERKIFFLDLKENTCGRFLKITEDVGGRRDTIMLPALAFKDFLEALQRLVEFEAKL